MTECEQCYLLECCCLTDKLDDLTDKIKSHNLAIRKKANRDFILSAKEIEEIKKEIETIQKIIAKSI
jgi:hypothetical protein